MLNRIEKRLPWAKIDPGYLFTGKGLETGAVIIFPMLGFTGILLSFNTMLALASFSYTIVHGVLEHTLLFIQS